MVLKVLRSRELRNEARFAPAQLEALIDELSPLAKADKNLTRQAIRFVADGDHEDCLLGLAGLKDAGEKLNLSATPTNPTGFLNFARLIANATRNAKRRRILLDPTPGVDPAAWARLGRVWEACARTIAGFQPPPDWPGWWMVLYSEILGLARARDEEHREWPVPTVAAAFESTGDDPELLVRMLVDEDAGGGHSLLWTAPTNTLGSWNDFLQRQTTAIQNALGNGNVKARAHAIGALSSAGYDFLPVAPLLTQQATATQKTLRSAAAAPMATIRDAARPEIERILREEGPARRDHAARLLHQLFPEDSRDFLRARRDEETSDKVRRTLDLLVASASSEAAAEKAPPIELPPVEIPTGTQPVPEKLRSAIRQALEQQFEEELRHYERALERWKKESAANRKRAKGLQVMVYKPNVVHPVGDLRLRKCFGYLEKGGAKAPRIDLRASIGDALSDPEILLVHIVRLDRVTGRLDLERRWSDWIHWNTREIDVFHRRAARKFGLRELAVAASDAGLSPERLAQHYLTSRYGWSPFLEEWDLASIWPFFAERPEVLLDALLPSSQEPDYLATNRRRAALEVLAGFPSLPAQVTPRLWELALGEAKTHRLDAQNALRTVPDKFDRILVALGDGKQGVRHSAADWLGRLCDPRALEPLRKALSKEKQEIVKGALLTALEALGGDVSEYLGRDVLAKEAKKGLAKRLPKGMDWVPLGSLPPVRWAEDDAPVDPEMVRWWVVQAVRRKTPVPGPLQRRILERCRRDDAAALARFVLSSWITEDTRTPNREEAEERARTMARQQWQAWGNSPWFVKHHKTEENLYRSLVGNFQNEFQGSAIGQKGLLAIAAAAGDRDCARMAERYIRKYYGGRLAQCKALLEVLAWNDDPLAIQILLSIANRFRTASIRKTAEAHVQALAERQGWTLDELADRTIPDAGFARETDEDGRPIGEEAVLVLDYGPRTFEVRLDDDLQPVITREDGKTVKSAPKPGKNDDEEKAKAARKELSAAKKMTKEVVKRQTERFYEGLCVQRTWRFGDWRRDLASHPIVGRLCTRLVWTVVGEVDEEATEALVPATPTISFRPLEDGSLTDAHDDEVTVPDDARIRLAHAAHASPEIDRAWCEHFTDYDVKPLFPQFGRETFRLTEDQEDATRLPDRLGHMLTTFQLRSQATKLGWIRGEAQDGGVFVDYRKSFPSLHLQAILEFTGSFVQEEDQQTALRDLLFVRLKEGGDDVEWGQEGVPLRKVPPVLLSECVNDVRQIAAVGTGFDPDWEAKGWWY